MKRLLSIIGVISLLGTSTTSLIACNKNNLDDEISIIKEKENKFYIKNFNNNYEYTIRFELYRDNKYYFRKETIPINYNGSIYKYKEQYIGGGQIHSITIKFYQDNNSKKWYIISNNNENIWDDFILNNILLVKVGK
ncbi:lipoprotein [Spiroplasma endosymbiont of Polydrusus pterygomalis]|uniref:lipoprotein n=1 Tax=Spiroplasma endosymbiont of Polydrusus pterygomalis TaxID=3139327 RepID=UPI003CCAC439